MNDFLAMGGYAAFVWPAYGLTFLVMSTLAATAWRRLKQQEQALAKLQAARESGK